VLPERIGAPFVEALSSLINILNTKCMSGNSCAQVRGIRRVHIVHVVTKIGCLRLHVLYCVVSCTARVCVCRLVAYTFRVLSDNGSCVLC
jgi:hypothetical protein